MNTTTIIAYLGAAAWLPQIIVWIYKGFVKPQVNFIPGPNPEIGYTTYGPILNLKCAITASRRDALIKKINMRIIHEKGQVTQLSWVTLNETFSQIRSTSGETAEVTKHQPAIALKVGTVDLIEKLIGFQDSEFHYQRNLFANKLVEVFNHAKKIKPENYHQDILDSKEFAEHIDFFRRGLPWRLGKYMAEVQIFIVQNRKPSIHKFEFKLSSNDIDRLNQNTDEIERFHRDLISPPLQPKQELWNWVNPKIVQA